jgi:SAM-dependent methyltransferase
MSARDTHDTWEGEIESEVAFWRQWIATGGDRWPEDFTARLDPQRPFDGLFADPVRALDGERLRILDVGSGPMTSLGKVLPGKQLEVVACDPLAPQYDRLLDEFGVVPPVRTVACDGERLLDRFEPEGFDVTHSRNALDHSYDPYAAVVGMLTCTRPGGLVLLSHFRCEAVNGTYHGFHQWNFDVSPDGAFLIWHPRGVVDVTARLRELADVRVVSAYGAASVEVVITRHEGTGGLNSEQLAERAGVATGFDRPLVELVVVDPAQDPAAQAAFRASVAAHAEEAASIVVTFVTGESALAELAPELPERAQSIAFLAVEDALGAPFPVRSGAISELAWDTSLASRAIGGGAPTGGLRGRIVRASSAPELIERMGWEATRLVGSGDRPRVICVLGYHRSGTSMTTRLLNLLGVDLGPGSDLVPAAHGDNPRGYWEPAWMVALNDELLRAFGGSDLEPPVFPAGWHRSPELQPLRDRARELLDEKLRGLAVWGVKDPRLCLTLPFWQDVLAERAEDVRYVVCLRSPADTAASMASRGYEPPIPAARLGAAWLEYSGAALAGTEGRPRLLVAYDELLADPVAEAARIAAFAGLELPPRERLEAAVEPGLRHHASTLLSTATDPELASAARAAYVALRAAARLRRFGDGSDLPDALERSAVELWRGQRPEVVAGMHGALVDAIGALQLADLAA